MQSEDNVSTTNVTQNHHRTQQSVYLTSVNQPVQIENYFANQMTKNFTSSIESTQYLTQDMFLGLGCADGSIRIMSTSKGDVQYLLRNIDHSPVSCLSLNPNSSNIKNSLIATHIDGTLQYWHATSQQLLFSKKYDEFLLACQISSDGHYYVFAGDKGHLKMGALSKGNPSDLQAGHIGSHDNRVFCLKWNPYDANVFYSGGWDKTVFTWDIRCKTAVSKLYGLYIGGNAIDVNDKSQLLLGNNTNEMPLRVYDMKGQKMRVIEWKHANQEQLHQTTGVMSCFFGQTSDQILAATPNRQLRLFKNSQCISRYQSQNKQKKIYSIAKSQTKRCCAVGWNNGDVQILKF